MPTSEWGHMTGAAGIVESLRRAGVVRVFAEGTADNSILFRTIQESPLELVVATYGKCASYMADAHARVTGELAACLLGHGAGLTNALQGIALARLDSSPLIALVPGTGHLLAHTRSGFYPDYLSAARPLCKEVFLIEESAEVPHVMAQAIQGSRRGEPGPVIVGITKEAQAQPARMEGTGFGRLPRILDDTAVLGLENACSMISKAQRVGIYAGKGCLEAQEEIGELVQHLSAPIATTLSGLGLVPFVHPWCTGFGLGRAGSFLTQSAFSSCDLILAVGCKIYPDMIRKSPNFSQADIIHIDIEPNLALHHLDISLQIKAPAKLALRRLIDSVPPKSHSDIHECIRHGKKLLKNAIFSRMQKTGTCVDPIALFGHLREFTGSDDVVYLDSGRHLMYGFASYPVQAPRTLLAPVDYAALGCSIPGAVAAATAQTDLRAIACVGDSGFLLTGMELLTARRCNLRPIVMVLSATPEGLTCTPNETILARETHAELAPVNYESMAHALAVGYVPIRNNQEIEKALTQAFLVEGPVIVDARVDYREAGPFLKVVQQDCQPQIPRPLALRLGARLIQRKILQTS